MHRLRMSIRARIMLLSMGFSALIALGVCLASLSSARRCAMRATAQSVAYGRTAARPCSP